MHIQFGLRAFALVLCASMAVAVLCFPSASARPSRVQAAVFNLAMVLPGLLWALLLILLYTGMLFFLVTGIVASAGAAADTDGIVFDCPAFLTCVADGHVREQRITRTEPRIGPRWELVPGSASTGNGRVRVSTSVDYGSRRERALRSAALLGVGGLHFLLAYALTRLTWWGLRRRFRYGTAGAG